MDAPLLPTSPAPSGWMSTEEQREAAWKFCATAIERHYEERLKRWNAELDMLLVFAGLFSTALTAFIVQSYPLLQPDNTDTVILALAYMSSQLESYSISQPFVNSTQKTPFIPASDAPFSAPSSAIWINGLWFSSLVCTLSASSIAVLVKQWLHQYSQSLSGTSPEVARLRQYRYDSLLKWHVPEIIAALPMLLQLALALFLSGLLILLWTLNTLVAIPASILIFLLVWFTAATTFFPIFYRDCCYQSPQALTFFLFAQTGARVTSKVLRVVERFAHQAALETTSWTSRKYVTLARLRDATRVLLTHLETVGGFSDWQAREKPDADAKHFELEQSLALTAYYTTFDNSMLNTTIIPCLSEMDALSARMSVRYADLLRDVTSKLVTNEWKTWRPIMPFVLTILSLITCEPRKGAIRKVLQAMPRHPLCAIRSRLGMLYLLAMSQLVSRRIAAREAFHRILVYLQRSRIDTEACLMPGSSVLEDVEATFPLKPAEIEELVDLDRTESVSYYLTGIEYTVKYLLRHRARLERDGSPASERVKNLLRGFKLFLHFPTWRTRRSRQGVLLWALRYSELPLLIRKIRADPATADLVEDDLVRIFREALSVVERGYIAFGNGMGEAASRGARRALVTLQEDLKTMEIRLHFNGSSAQHGEHYAQIAAVSSEVAYMTLNVLKRYGSRVTSAR
ncbi:hypothetical protein L226DRAFT_96782 [Lentinus tigrinus ALCF2SS1-7]|uniref:uncharacterized protein n=1 Tax=Lentinus tigrinus ALCF2SS1-7 TaxID=1328758 RepID=UPI001165D467|nr:hypothetical protein L226DRAFT_96782 [Lentinus tigrinus ALCF2SS1-7]